jgi:tellurite resistance protein TehA-like permease
MDDKQSFLQAALTPTPQNGVVSGAIGVGMVKAQGVVEDVTTIFGYTPSEWTAFAAIAALSYSLLCIILAMPRLLELLRKWFP